MPTYLDSIARKYNSESNHAFVLYGATRDLQLGQNGSLLIEQHLMQTQAEARIVVTFCVGAGWKFAGDAERATFKQITGIDQASGDFAGLTSNSDSDDLPIDVPSAIGLIDTAMRQSEKKVMLVLDRAELIAPAQSYDRMAPSDKAVLALLGKLAVDRAVESTGNMIIMITDNLIDLHESLRLASSRYFAIEITPPSAEERLSIAQSVFPQLEDRGVVLELSPEAFASATSMLTRYGLMDIVLDAQAQLRLSKDQVKAVKAQVLSQEYGDVLEPLEPLPTGFDAIAGLEPLKELFDEIVTNMIGGDLGDVPTGILFAGAAGLGKSYFMRGVAGACGLPVINFNVGRLLGSFVGQSERNLERALTAIRSAAPCIVVIDEIETTFPDRANAAPSGDSGVSSRILKRMLEELSDPSNRGKILWVGITNFPNKLDAALSRAGRFDLTVAMLPPTERERLALLMLYAKKYAVNLPYNDQILESTAKLLVGYTNAEIENVVRKVRALFKTYGTDQAWQEAPKRVRANTRDVQLMTNLALSAVNDSDMLPVEYIDQWRKITNQAPEATGTGTQERKRVF